MGKILATREELGIDMTSLDRRTYLTLMSAAGAGLVAGCADGDGSGDGDTDVSDGSDGDDEIEEGGTLLHSFHVTFDTIDPHRTGSNVPPHYLVADQLWKLNTDMELVEHLARDVSYSDGGSVWEIEIREGVEFHEPLRREMVAEDIKKNYERGMEIGVQGGTVFSAFEEIEVIDDYNLDIHLSAPSAGAQALIYWLHGQILNPDQWEEEDIDPANHPIGTGPWKFEEYEPRRHVIYSRNEHYWDEENIPTVDELEVRIIEEPATLITELTAGDLHIADKTPLDNVPTLQQDDRISITEVEGAETNWLELNVSPFDRPLRSPEKPTNDQNIRHAINEAIDREELVEIVAAGFGSPTQIYHHENSPWHIDYEPYSNTADVSRAEDLIAQSDFQPPIEVNLVSTTDDPNYRDTGRVIQSHLEAVGFEVEIHETDFGTYVDNLVNYSYDISTRNAEARIDPIQNTGYFRDDVIQPWPVHQEDPEMHNKITELYAELDQETDFDARYETFTELKQLIVDFSAFVALFHSNVVEAKKETVRGHVSHPWLQNWKLENVWLDE